ncbi:hypothetical protein B0H11DRAFT_1943103 [Mycena galericulata]|nr:hypothetical protein B0H11DRAFT_1943103 [Mycena galericulata]
MDYPSTTKQYIFRQPLPLPTVQQTTGDSREQITDPKACPPRSFRLPSSGQHPVPGHDTCSALFCCGQQYLYPSTTCAHLRALLSRFSTSGHESGTEFTYWTRITPRSASGCRLPDGGGYSFAVWRTSPHARLPGTCGSCDVRWRRARYMSRTVASEQRALLALGLSHRTGVEHTPRTYRETRIREACYMRGWVDAAATCTPADRTASGRARTCDVCGCMCAAPSMRLSAVDSATSFHHVISRFKRIHKPSANKWLPSNQITGILECRLGDPKSPSSFCGIPPRSWHFPIETSNERRIIHMPAAHSRAECAADGQPVLDVERRARTRLGVTTPPFSRPSPEFATPLLRHAHFRGRGPRSYDDVACDKRRSPTWEGTESVARERGRRPWIWELGDVQRGRGGHTGTEACTNNAVAGYASAGCTNTSADEYDLLDEDYDNDDLELEGKLATETSRLGGNLPEDPRVPATAILNLWTPQMVRRSYGDYRSAGYLRATEIIRRSTEYFEYSGHLRGP